MTKRRTQLLDDARDAGFDVDVREDGTTIIKKVGPKSGLLIRGICIWPNDWAVCLGADLANQKCSNSYADWRNELGIK